MINYTAKLMFLPQSQSSYRGLVLLASGCKPDAGYKAIEKSMIT